MTTTLIKGIPVRFPFEPYQIQKDYMEKVIECLQNNENGVLESPTGTGKTLSLLCSSLAWLEVKKAQIQAQRLVTPKQEQNDEFLKNLQEQLNAAGGKTKSGRAFLGVPTIIYASRTHSQLSQAMQELKRADYKNMRACVIGSREQMCVHEEVIKETSNPMKVQLCRLKVKARACLYYNRVERKKDDPVLHNASVMDIEDMVTLGKTHRFCPYYMAKEFTQNADVVFMPYNYLLDPRARKVFGVSLANNIIILDEAHNVEKICEDSASIQIKSTDVTLCIEEVTVVMKALSEDVQLDFNDPNAKMDFTPEEVCVLKQIFLDFEKALDAVELKNNSPEDTNLEGTYIYELFEKAGINNGNFNSVLVLIDNLVQFLAAVTINDGSPFQRRGVGLQIFSDLLTVAYAGLSEQFRERIKKCYKVHITTEDPKKKAMNNWFSKATAQGKCRVLSFWCFSPGFGMQMLLDQGIHCLILTSGTLAPLKALISELELNSRIRLENPHIVKGDQVCVKILTKGPDNEQLNCNYRNRDNVKYLQSLGMVLLNLMRTVPHGVLIFFPSYPIMQKCQQYWQETGVWSGLNNQKPIFVEPKDKISFNNAMSEYYSKIKDPVYNGAIFMGVCRGKVSEGLDFADANGRAVFIIGLPYPPLKDPRVILKRRYLDLCNAKDKEFLRGEDWYSLEATRAVNQAIGRVIRHQNDFGAIILLDSRFTNYTIKNNLSLWLRQHIKVAQNFGEVVRDLRTFFKIAKDKLPPLVKPEIINTPIKSEPPQSSGFFDFSSSSAESSTSTSEGLVRIYDNPQKRRKITVMPNVYNQSDLETSTKEYIIMVKKTLDDQGFKSLLSAMTNYKSKFDIDELIKELDVIFLNRFKERFVIPGLEPYIKEWQKEEFLNFCEKMK